MWRRDRKDWKRDTWGGRKKKEERSNGKIEKLCVSERGREE